MKVMRICYSTGKLGISAGFTKNSVEYTNEAHQAMTWLIFKFNDTFGLLIDDSEDEVLPAEQVGKAVELAKEFERSAPEIHKPVINEFIALLEFARDTNMPVAFNF